MSVISEPTARLRAFRERLYACMGRRADALFELCDACLTEGTVPSPVHLSLASAHRSGWGSLYAALAKGRMREANLAINSATPVWSQGLQKNSLKRVFGRSVSLSPGCSKTEVDSGSGISIQSPD